MAYVKLTIALLLVGSGVNAQNFSEWFRQKSTQKKYLIQQIAALQVYSGYLSKGYGIAQGGLGSIGVYINREFVQVNPLTNKTSTSLLNFFFIIHRTELGNPFKGISISIIQKIKSKNRL